MPLNRTEMSAYAPRMIKYLQDQSGEDPRRDRQGGAVIRALSEETRCQIDIQDDGTSPSLRRTPMTSPNARSVSMASRPKSKWARSTKVRSSRIMDFGAVIQLLPGRDGLLHISQIANERVNAVTDFFKEGDLVKVRYLASTTRGRVKLSRKCCLTSRRRRTTVAPATHATVVAGCDRKSGAPVFLRNFRCWTR